MQRFFLCLLSLAVISGTLAYKNQLNAADKTVEKYQKVLSGNDSAAKKKAVSALASGGDDADRMPALIAAARDRQVSKFALEALQRRTGLKPAMGSRAGSGYPGHPASNSAGGWSTWWDSKKAEEAQKQEMEDIKQKAKEAEEKAQAALDGEEEEEDGEEEEEVLKKKKEIPDHEKYGSLDRIIFKSGNLMMCYIVSKQVDLDGQLTSIDIVHRNGAGEESISAELIASIDENIN